MRSTFCLGTTSRNPTVTTHELSNENSFWKNVVSHEKRKKKKQYMSIYGKQSSPSVFQHLENRSDSPTLTSQHSGKMMRKNSPTGCTINKLGPHKM